MSHALPCCGNVSQIRCAIASASSACRGVGIVDLIRYARAAVERMVSAISSGEQSPASTIVRASARIMNWAAVNSGVVSGFFPGPGIRPPSIILNCFISNSWGGCFTNPIPEKGKRL